jgi:replication factor C subunit 3/5
MTFDAQFALRRIIEKYSETTRFCLICNYENKIIPAIRSRCANFKFNPIEKSNIIDTLDNIAKNENLIIQDNSLEIISNLSNGDLRKAINLLQSISMKSNIISPIICFETAGIPTNNEIELILNYLTEIHLDTKNIIDFNDIYNNLNLIIKNNGYSLDVILKELTLKILNIKIISNKAQILSDLADLENKITKSIFTDIYISSLISIFINKN